MIDELREMYDIYVEETMSENEEYRDEEEVEGLTKVAENVPSTLDVEELVEKVETVAKTPASKRPRPKKQPNNSSKP